MPNPVRQMILWFTEMIQGIAANWGQVSTALAIVTFGYLVFVLVQRLRSDNDPSLRYQSSSAAGTTSILLSGVHVTMLLAGGIALLTWPLPIENTLVGLSLLGAVATHYAIEKREVGMN